MLMLKTVLCILMIAGFVVFTTSERSCFDCVSLRSCEAALDLAKARKAGQLLQNAFCGMDKRTKTPKVCCSDFPVSTKPVALPLPTTPAPIISLSVPGPESRFSSPSVPDQSSINAAKIEELLPDPCGDIDGSRIVGGTHAKLYELPWMTLISYHTSEGLDFQCGGSVITSRYILTAAHCVVVIKSRYTNDDKVLKKIAGVRIGELDIETPTDCQGTYENMICESKLQDLEVEKIIPHPDYSKYPLPKADIALLRLKTPIDFVNNAAPVCLPVTNELRNMHIGGRNVTIAGWGATEEDTFSTVLLKANVEIVPDDTCRRHYYKDTQVDVTEDAFCAGKVGTDSCQGDSGGPLIIEADYKGKPRFVQYGVVSHGPKPCGTQIPGVYTDVRKYVNWILETIVQ